jgi:hypothetical protein
MKVASKSVEPVNFELIPHFLSGFEKLGRVCKLTMDPRHSSIRLFRKAASELLCKHALVFIGVLFYSV